MAIDLLSEFAPMFYPKSVAVIGASADRRKFAGVFLATLLSFGYDGKIYPVNPQESDILGLKTYQAVSDIPEPVDFAVITVPAHAVPVVIKDCVTKRVKAAEILTSGFREIGEEGQKLEQEIARIAAKRIRIIGPNCFGIYCPAGGLTILPGADFSTESGPVAFISQSGGYAVRVPRRGQGLGIKFSKVVSYGNACDVDESDLLEYLGQDPETKIITGYIEGVKDAHRFFKLLQKVSQTKPVILWKGGITQSGARAAYSHTGSLAGAEAVWDAVFKQTGAIRVNSLEELLDTTLAFLHLGRHRGRKVAVVGGGGGITVTATDICERVGLSVPLFPLKIQRKLAAVVPKVGTSIRNPVDVGLPYPPPAILRAVLETIATEGDVDTIIVDEIEMTMLSRRTKHLEEAYGAGLEENTKIPVEVKKRSGKSLMMVLPVEATGVDTAEGEIARRKICDYYLSEGIPVYLTLERAAKALSNLVGCYEHLDLLSKTV